MSRYYCADGRRIPEGHEPEECPPCLRAMRDGIRKEYEANVNVDLLARLREMDRRIQSQRHELARLSQRVAGAPSPVSAWDAFTAWAMPGLDRWDRRFAGVCFRSGWQAARRALVLPDDTAGQSESVAK